MIECALTGNLLSSLCAAAAIPSLGLALVIGLGAAGAARADDHILAIGVCPPWAGVPPAVCQGAVASMTKALASRYDVPEQNRHSLLNDKATVAGFVDLLDGLPAMTKDDRLFLYTVMHNGSGHEDQAATAGDDVLVFWSDQDPGVIEFAIAEEKWMNARDFADAIGQLGVGTLVAILEDCQSGAFGLEVLHESSPETARVVTIASAKAGQYANLTMDMTQPLFSSLLVPAMADGTTPMSDLLSDVTTKVTERSGPICAARKTDTPAGKAYTPTCRQTPVIRDPQALLPGL